jgi:glutamate-1-semialdehyde 2,1-aminomutase
MSTPTETRLEDVLEDAKLRFTEQNQRSKSLHEEATKSLPGGNTRTVLHTSPFPVYMKSGKGYQVVSEDGKTYDRPPIAELPAVCCLLSLSLSLSLSLYRLLG